MLIRTSDLNVSLQEIQDLLNNFKHTGTQIGNFPVSQSAAVMLQQSPRVKTRCAALDQILDGGLRRGHILEISGPPGSPKEKLVINIISVFAEAEEDILFVGKRTIWESFKIFRKPC